MVREHDIPPQVFNWVGRFKRSLGKDELNQLYDGFRATISQCNSIEAERNRIEKEQKKARAEGRRFTETYNPAPNEEGFINKQGNRESYLIFDYVENICESLGREYLEEMPDPMPIEPECTLRYPGISPKGKYSMIEMEFAYRMNKVDTGLEFAGNYATERVKALRSSDSFRNLTQSVQEVSKRYREKLTASKMVDDREIRQRLESQAANLRTAKCLQEYEDVMHGLEYLAQVRNDVPSEAVCDKLQRDYGFPNLRNQSLYMRQNDIQPDLLHVNFECYDDKITQQMFSNIDENNGLSNASAINEFAETHQSRINVYNGIKPYCNASIKNILEPLTARAQEHGLNVSDLIIVDGESVQERLEKMYPNPADRTPERIKDHTCMMITCALFNDNRVEVYMPRGQNIVSATPTRIVPEGYTPRRQAQPVVLNAWERFFSHLGFYKEKVAQAKTYQDQLAEQARSDAARARLGEKLHANRHREAPARQM